MTARDKGQRRESQAPMTFDLSLGESAGFRSLRRLVLPPIVISNLIPTAGG